MTLRSTFTVLVAMIFLAPTYLFSDCQISCYPFLQVSIGYDCSGEVTVGMLMSGNNNCAGPFEVVVMTEDMQPIDGSPFLGPEHVGMTLMASVIDTDSGNQCMSTLLIEDKFIPDLVCSEVSFPCNEEYNLSIPDQFIENTGWQIDNTCQEISIPVSGITNIADINMAVSFSAVSTAGLFISLESPSGISVDLIDGSLVTPCGNSEFDLLLDSHASTPLQNLWDGCSESSENFGCYPGLEAFGPFLEELQINGNWTLTACAGPGDQLSLNVVDLQISQEGLMIPFPVTAGSEVSQDGQDFIVDGFDSCGPAQLSYSDQSQNENCSSENQETILRTWVIQDGYGTSTSCTQTINILKSDPSDISIPPDFGPGGEPTLACDEKEPDPGNQITPSIGWNALQNGHPSPYNEYYPAPNEDVIKWFGTGFPDLGSCSDLVFAYTDSRLNACSEGASNGCFSIIRNWIIMDNCTGGMVTEKQTIKISDNEAPIISGIGDYTLEILDAQVCVGNAYAPV
ncbi:MAG: hypothetical protein HKN16_09360, partial [Saprospiraceae bacterium]|nr:hypothetical protein [Saprospiraceae bacterium]